MTESHNKRLQHTHACQLTVFGETVVDVPCIIGWVARYESFGILIHELYKKRADKRCMLVLSELYEEADRKGLL